ncbi:hypothetical protein QVD99_002246 [Batrachochytrium dendrobatidis]|nr:hypothetical protein QVD99_002246 [Batrachochytrium dendrobatidis]
MLSCLGRHRRVLSRLLTITFMPLFYTLLLTCLMGITQAQSINSTSLQSKESWSESPATSTPISSSTATATLAILPASTSSLDHELSLDAYQANKTTFSGCLNNCSGVGKCLKNGACQCPPPRIPSWWKTYGLDCSNYRLSFSYAWPYFRYSWLLVYTLCLLLLSFFNYQTFRANGWYLGGVRHICQCLIHTAIFTRFLFFSIDPYSVSSTISPIVSRMLLSSFYLFFILAYVIMALHWVDICRTALALTPSKTLRFAHIGATILVLSFVSLQVFITISQLNHVNSRQILFADTLSMTLIMVLFVPLYLYYGYLFTSRLKLVRKDKEGKRDRLIKKVRVISLGPATAGLTSALIMIVKIICFRHNPYLFLIGESASHFFEMISVALFLYGILLDTTVKPGSLLTRRTTYGRSIRTTRT